MAYPQPLHFSVVNTLVIAATIRVSSAGYNRRHVVGSHASFAYHIQPNVLVVNEIFRLCLCLCRIQNEWRLDQVSDAA
jgi:hypothetical protein